MSIPVLYFSLESNSSFPSCITTLQYVYSVCACSLSGFVLQGQAVLIHLSREITFPFLSLFVVPVLCMSCVLDFLGIGKQFATYCWVRSYKCHAQCHPFFTVSAGCVISHASLNLIFLFLWPRDISDLGTLEIHWCPVASDFC